MKKKILLVLSLMALAACLFALSVSAVEVDGIYYSLNGAGEDAYAAVSAENRTGCTLETVVIPATIEVEGVTYKVTKIEQNAFGIVNGDPNAYIKHLVIGENVSAVEQHAFRRVASLETVVIKNTNADSPISFYNAQFMYCSSLKSVDAKDAKISTYGGNCFDGCSSLETIDYPSMLTSIGSRAFTDCVKLTSGDLSNTQVTSIGSWAYGSCKSITEFKFPSTLTTIGNNNFLYCPVETYVFPHSMKSFGKDMLAHQSKLKVLIMPAVDENTTGISGFLYSTRPNVIIYSGDNVEYFVSLHSAFASYDVKPFAEYVEGTTYAKNTIFYGSGNTCADCNGFVEKEANFKYVDLLTEMKVSRACTHCGTENVTERYEAVFVDLGYSAANINGVYSIMQGFKVNYESIDVYGEKVGTEISEFGVIAVADFKVDGTAFNDDGTVKNGVVHCVTSARNDLLNIKVTGLSADATLSDGTSQLDAKLHACAYVKVGEEIYYVSEGYVGTTLGSAVSYNDIAE